MIRELPIPLGYIAGAEDPVIAGRSAWRKTPGIDHQLSYMLNGAGHMGMIEDSDAFWRP